MCEIVNKYTVYSRPSIDLATLSGRVFSERQEVSVKLGNPLLSK